MLQVPVEHILLHLDGHPYEDKEWREESKREREEMVAAGKWNDKGAYDSISRHDRKHVKKFVTKYDLLMDELMTLSAKIHNQEMVFQHIDKLTMMREELISYYDLHKTLGEMPQ